MSTTRSIVLGAMLLAGCGAPSAKPAAPTAASTAASTGAPAPAPPPAPGASTGSGFFQPPASNAKLSTMFADDQCSTVKGGTEAFDLFTKACNGRDAQGCFQLSLRYLCGVGTARDALTAAKVSEQACDLGAAEGCGNAATIYMAPDQDQSKAFAVAQKGCTLGNSLSCAYVGICYWQGLGVAPDAARAAKIFDVECKKDNLMACANYAVELYMGQGIPRDLPRATELAEMSCAGRMPAGCNILAAALLEQGGDDNDDRAQLLLSQVCDAGGGPSCDNLGQLYWHGAGRIKADNDKAKLAFKRACDLQNALGCTHLGQLVSQ